MSRAYKPHPRTRRSSPSKLRRAQRVVFIILLGICFFAVRWSLQQVAYFNVTSIEVEGCHIVPVSVVAEIALPYKGVNLFKVKPGVLEQRLQSFYQIRKATVHRNLPNRLYISIVETQALAAIQLADAVKWIDDQGRVLNTFGKDENFDGNLPMIHGVPRAAFRDQGLRLQTTWLNVLRSVVAVLPQKQLSLLFQSPQDVILYYEDNLRVMLGQPKDLARKLNQLRVLLQNVDASMLEYVDLRFPENTVIKTKMNMALAPNSTLSVTDKVATPEVINENSNATTTN